MFQLCRCNADSIVYCLHEKCIHLLLYTFYTCTVFVDLRQGNRHYVWLHNFIIIIFLQFVAVLKWINYQTFLQMENVTKHTIADMLILCMEKYLVMSEEVFQDPISYTSCTKACYEAGRMY